jgi:hypothetical protein
MSEQVTRRVIVEWHDTPNEPFETTVAITNTWPEYEDDDTIFFFFRNEAELEEAKTGEGYEFRIVEVLA